MNTSHRVQQARQVRAFSFRTRSRNPTSQAKRIILIGNNVEKYEVHNEETLQNLSDSLEALKQLLRTQKEHIRQVEHERDLLAAGYKAAMDKCAELEASMHESILID